jgi:hypothetical protein
VQIPQGGKADQQQLFRQTDRYPGGQKNSETKSALVKEYGREKYKCFQ